MTQRMKNEESRMKMTMMMMMMMMTMMMMTTKKNQCWRFLMLSFLLSLLSSSGSCPAVQLHHPSLSLRLAFRSAGSLANIARNQNGFGLNGC